MANEAKQFTIGGVTHDVMDVGARQAIASLQNAIDAITSGDTTTAIKTFQEVIDFLDGVTDDATLIGKLNELRTLINEKYSKPASGIPASDLANGVIPDVSVFATKSELNAKANSADVVPNSRTINGKALSSNVTIGMSDIQGLETAIADAGKVKSVSVNGGTAQTPDGNGNVNIEVEGGGETVVINSDGANIVDEHDNNSVLLAPSARQMKLMYNNLMAIYNSLANIAFTNGKPTLDWVGAKTKYTLAYGTLNGCTADVAAGQVNEGALRIKLTPTQASYAFTSVTVNGQSAQTTATGDADGSVYLDIVVNGNITVAATAISGRGITFNGTGCSIGASGVAIGQDLDTTITANEHFTLPASITVKIGNTNVTHTYTRAQDNKTATLHIDAANITGDLTITCTADEDAHVTLAISGSNFVVKQGNTQLSNNSKVYNGSAAQTLTIEPASGYKFSTLPSADKGTMTNNGYYEASSLVIGTSVEGTLTITAAGAALDTLSIDLSGLVGVTSSNLAESILEGSPYSTTLTKTDASAAGSVIIGTCTMGNEDITPPSGSTISVAHVTGNIVIAASVGTQPMKVHSWGYSYSTDSNGKKYLNDGEGDFWLYNQADAGYNTNNIPAGYYANSIEGRNIGYGSHRNLGVPLESSFTLVIKGLVIDRTGKGGSTGAYLSKQHELRLFDRVNVNQGTGGVNYGQFRMMLSAEATGTSADQFYPKIEYCDSNGSIASFFFSSVKTDAPEPDGHQYDYVLSYNASTKEINVYRVDIYNGGVTVELAGTKTANDKLILPTIAYIPSSTYFKGLDVYNYALNQSQIEQEYSSNN